jgi:hypothetical protein
MHKNDFTADLVFAAYLGICVDDWYHCIVELSSASGHWINISYDEGCVFYEFLAMKLTPEDIQEISRNDEDGGPRQNESPTYCKLRLNAPRASGAKYKPTSCQQLLTHRSAKSGKRAEN